MIHCEWGAVGFSINSGVITALNKKIEIIVAVSNNGDGINDRLTIRNIEKFPDNHVDRYGRTVFSAEHYNNNDVSFCGVSNVGNSDHIPSGTYYFD